MTAEADQIRQLEAAIAAQDALRPVLGDPVVDTTIAALRASLAALELRARIPDALADKIRAAAEEGASGERRTVTVLFADLSGFTGLGERFDPEVIRTFQGELFDEMARAVYEYEGFVEKFVGDAVLAVFGAPLAHEDDPERALRAALAIRDRIAVLDARWAERLGQPLTVHVGIDSGTVVAGRIGSADAGGYAVTGDTINTASRLQGAAEAGQILVGERTQRLTHEAFSFRALPPLTLRGKREPIAAFELERARLHPGKSRGVQGLHSPMVGRDAELAALGSVAERLHAGSGRIVLISGDAGIGKSRLLAEWRVVLGHDVRWLEGRSLASATGQPYGPFVDLCRRFAGITDDDTEARARSRLRRAFKRILPDDPGALAIVIDLLGMRLEPAELTAMEALSPQGRQQALFGLAERMFERLASQRPTVLALEDLHWADRSSMELIEQLLPLTRRLPLAIVGAIRGDPAAMPLWTILIDGYADRLTTIEVRPLEESASVSLVEHLLSTGDLAATARSLIVGKAEGNPFFVEEVIRSLIDRRALARSDDGGWMATTLLDRVAVPDSLQGVLMARLDRLPETTKRVAQQASVMGRTFLFPVLARLAGDPSGLPADLDHLEREALILELHREPERIYTFRHALTQEVAYESLLGAQRRDLHARVGEAMEAVLEDRVGEHLASLGGHFLRGEAWEKAATYFRQAGDAAMRVHANPEARLHFGKALQALAALPQTDERRRQTVDLTLKQVAVSWGADDPGRNLARLAEVEVIARALPGEDGTPPDEIRLARVQYWMGRIHYYRDEPREALVDFQRAIEVGQALGDTELLAIPSALMGRTLIMQGHFDRGEALLTRALGPLERTEEWLEWAYSKAFLGAAMAVRGEGKAGLAESRMGLARARETDDPTAVAGCLATIAFHHYLARDGGALAEAGRVAAEAGEAAGSPLLVYIGLGFGAIGHDLLGEPGVAREQLTAAQATAASIGGRLFLADWFAAADAQLALHAGDAATAIDKAEAAVALSRTIQGIFGEGFAQRVWGLAIAALAAPETPDPAAADDHLGQSVALFESGGCLVEAAYTRLDWGILLRDSGDVARAAEQLGRAATFFEAAGLDGPLERARVRTASSV